MGSHLAIGIFIALALSSLATPYRASAQNKDPDPAAFQELLDSVRKEHQLPAMVGALVRGDKIIAEAAVGIREIGKNDPVTLDDRFMICSCTKRMTSVMILRVIDGGKLGF